MGNLRIWRGVPDGSRLEIAVVEGEDGDPRNFNARGELREDLTNRTMTWTDAQLQRRKPPTIEPLTSPNVYTGRVRVSFTADGVARVRALVRKPDGRIFGKTYQYSIQGTNGDIVTATIIITTIQD